MLVQPRSHDETMVEPFLFGITGERTRRTITVMLQKKHRRETASVCMHSQTPRQSRQQQQLPKQRLLLLPSQIALQRHSKATRSSSVERWVGDCIQAVYRQPACSIIV
jgi:hypothetical protein